MIDPLWQCANPAVVNGLSWTLKAIADVHADDFSHCATLAQAFGSECSVNVSDDDDNDVNNTLVKAHPIVNFTP